MSAIRRSTRLSSTNAAGLEATIPTTPKRRSELWRLRQPKHLDDSEASEDDDNPHSTSNLSILKERNENRSANNKNPSIKSHNKSIKVISAESPIDNVLKTPRSIQHQKSVSRKMESSSKRKSDNAERLILSVNDAQGISPPKITRCDRPSTAHHLISPSRLLDRLSLDERIEISSSSSSSDTEETKEKKVEVAEIEKTNKVSPPRNKYQNARRVLNSAETQNLPGREQQLQELREFFTIHLNEQTSGSLYVSGQPGTGKTACLSLLLNSPEISKSLQCSYINCTSIASVGSVYKKICDELKITVNGRTERERLEAIKRHLCKSPRMTLIVLDEIDQLCTSRQSVLYTIFEWPALPKSRLLLVGIANSLDLTDRALLRLNARCELKPRLMHFPPYTKQQIVEIFRVRLEKAGVLEVFPPVTLQLLAAKVSAVSGDVRRALDIGRRVVEIAEQQKKVGKRVVNLNELDLDCEKTEVSDTLKPVQVSQVVDVLNKVYGASQNLGEDIQESFPLQQKLVLCTLMLMLRNEKNKDITIGRFHEVYRRVCNKRNICALDQAEFAGLVDLVETRGIIRIMRKKEPRFSKVQLQWDEDEVNAALSDKQLIATILNDTTCLRSGP